jgi:hypothetical protein
MQAGTDLRTLLGVSALANDLDVIANLSNPNTPAMVEYLLNCSMIVLLYASLAQR